MTGTDPHGRSAAHPIATAAIIAIFVVAGLVAVFGAWPILRDCGRLPLGQGEVWNRILGLSDRC